MATIRVEVRDDSGGWRKQEATLDVMESAVKWLVATLQGWSIDEDVRIFLDDVRLH